MDGPPFLISILVNKECFARTLIDTGYLSYGLVDSRFATKNKLQRISIPSRDLTGFDAPSIGQVTEIAAVSIDIDNYYKKRSFFYIVPRLASYDIILEIP